MNDKLILIKEYKLFINRFEFIVINIDNRYKDIKSKILNTMYEILELMYYSNILEKNKRSNYQRKIICKIKMLDYYFNKLLKYKLIEDIHYENISKNLITILKLVFGWMK